MTATLFLSAYAPRRGTGRGARTYGVVAALARLAPVELAYAPFDGGKPDATYAALPGVTYRAVPTSARHPRRAAAYARARLAGAPGDWARGVLPELAALAAAAPAGTRVVADGPLVAQALRGVARSRPVAMCAHNLESAFRSTVPGERTRGLARFERGLLAAMDESWMVSRADLEGAGRLCPGARLRHVPNVVDVAAVRPVAAPGGQRRALFLADLTYRPNAEALRFLADEVAPRLWRALPDARIAVAGRGEARLPADPRAEALGFVDDVAGAYAAADAVVVPLLQGGGSPLKFVEALAHGVPVVATSRAAAGLDGLRAGEHFVVADGAEDFAAALARVLREGAPEIARAGRAFAERELSIEALVERLR